MQQVLRMFGDGMTQWLMHLTRKGLISNAIKCIVSLSMTLNTLIAQYLLVPGTDSTLI